MWHFIHIYIFLHRPYKDEQMHDVEMQVMW